MKIENPAELVEVFWISLGREMKSGQGRREFVLKVAESIGKKTKIDEHKLISAIFDRLHVATPQLFVKECFEAVGKGIAEAKQVKK